MEDEIHCHDIKALGRLDGHEDPGPGKQNTQKGRKKKDGRIMVEALLYDIETRKTPDLLLNALHRQGVKKVRKELGLD